MHAQKYLPTIKCSRAHTLTNTHTHNTLTYTQINHLACKLANDVVDVNEEGDTLMKAANDANHGDITLMPL